VRKWGRIMKTKDIRQVTKAELLEQLERVKKHLPGYHVYDAFKQLIESHPDTPDSFTPDEDVEELVEEWDETRPTDIRGYAFSTVEAFAIWLRNKKHLFQSRQPKRVSRERLDKIACELVGRFDEECGLSNLQKTGIYHVLTEKGDLEDIYMELGIEVSDK